MIDHAAIEVFIESQRTDQNGSGKILAIVSGYYDSDSSPDSLVVYAYEHGPNPGDKAHEMFSVAFLTESFETTDILIIPETDMVPHSLLEYSSHGNGLILTGEKRLSGDAMCCPSAVAFITLTVSDGEVVILESEYRGRTDRD